MTRATITLALATITIARGYYYSAPARFKLARFKLDTRRVRVIVEYGS